MRYPEDFESGFTMSGEVPRPPHEVTKVLLLIESFA
jgi:hypothetical protein